MPTGSDGTWLGCLKGLNVNKPAQMQNISFHYVGHCQILLKSQRSYFIQGFIYLIQGYIKLLLLYGKITSLSNKAIWKTSVFFPKDMCPNHVKFNFLEYLPQKKMCFFKEIGKQRLFNISFKTLQNNIHTYYGVFYDILAYNIFSSVFQLYLSTNKFGH